ncbi:GbsR/MarR family transcriptional regulator [Candidatus Altiarchaeota archaeon]
MQETIREVKGDITEHYTKLFEEFGMNPTMIKVYMSLFFSKEPLGLQELADDTGYSVSTICQTADLLEKYVDVRKFKNPGSKKSYYECQHDIKTAMRKKFGGMREMMQDLVRVLKESEEKLKTADDEETKRISGHITKLRKDYEKADKLFAILMTMNIIGKGGENE